MSLRDEVKKACELCFCPLCEPKNGTRLDAIMRLVEPDVVKVIEVLHEELPITEERIEAVAYNLQKAWETGRLSTPKTPGAASMNEAAVAQAWRDGRLRKPHGTSGMSAAAGVHMGEITVDGMVEKVREANTPDKEGENEMS